MWQFGRIGLEGGLVLVAAGMNGGESVEPFCLIDERLFSPLYIVYLFFNKEVTK